MIAMLLDCSAALANTTNFVEISETKAGIQKIKIILPEDTKLTKQEITQVVKLAKQNGITRPEEVSIFSFLPGGGKGIRVKSIESRDSRNTSFDTVDVYKIGWSVMETNSKTKLLGNFWANEEGRRHTVLRDYKSTNGTTFQVSIGNGVEFSAADKLVDSYLSGKLFPARKNDKDGIIELVQFGLDDLKNAKPEVIRRVESEKCFEMGFDNYPTTVVKLRFEKDKIVIIETYSYVI